jgi:hypothetical protein
MAFKPAVRYKAKLRMALCGVAGAGKTFTALAIGTRIGKKVALIDTEGGEDGKANKYGSGDPFTFGHDTLYKNFHPQEFIDKIHDAEKGGFDLLIIDSLTHAWTGEGGVLDLADKIANKSSSGNSYTAWNKVTPIHRKLIDTILESPLHIIVTIRSKMAYEIETSSSGKKVPKKVGLAPVQRDDVPYEFDIVATMDKGNMIVDKSMCNDLGSESISGGVFKKPDDPYQTTPGTNQVSDILIGWLNTGDNVLPQHEASARREQARHVVYLQAVEKARQEPGDGTVIWSDAVAGEFRKIREMVSVEMGEEKSYVPEDVTRIFLKTHFDIDSHKQMTGPMKEATTAYLRECFKYKEILV